METSSLVCVSVYWHVNFSDLNISLKLKHLIFNLKKFTDQSDSGKVISYHIFCYRLMQSTNEHFPSTWIDWPFVLMRLCPFGIDLLYDRRNL